MGSTLGGILRVASVADSEVAARLLLVCWLRTGLSHLKARKKIFYYRSVMAGIVAIRMISSWFEYMRERDEDEDDDEDVNADEDDDEVRKEPALVRSLYVELENTQRPKNHVPRTPLIAPCYAVAWSPDCTTLATGGYERLVKLWSVATGGRIASLRGHDGPISCVEFSPDGATLATGSEDMTIKLWTVSTGVCGATLCGHENEVIDACAWSPDGFTLASAGDDGT